MEDLDSQIIDLDFSRKGLAEWGATFGNVRQMHSTNLPPAGKAIEVDTSRPDGVYLTARIVEPTAVKLVKEGVYSAFSVGISKPRIIRDKVAKNGRVVDGVFSEVSVVDFPALPTAKFEIMKRAKDEIEVLEKSLTPVGTLFKKRSEPMADAEVKDDAEVKKAGVECEVCKGSGKDADGADCEKCMGKGVQSEVEKVKGKVPAIDEEISEELAEADDAIHDAQAAQAADEAGHESGTPEENVVVPDDDEEDEKAKKALGTDLTYAMRRAHDATCPAYSNDTAESVHPSIAKFGVKGVVDPEIIRSAISAAVASDAFSPTVLRSLTDAFDAAVALVDAPDAEVAAARDALTKAFQDAYPDAHPTPGSVTPGQFQRPFIGTGRAPATSTGAAPRVPFVGENAAEATDFDREGGLPGRERTAPESSESWQPATMSAADQMTAVSRDHAMVSLRNLHDHLSAAYPDICALDTSTKPAAAVAGYANSGIETMDMSGSLNHVKTTAAVPTIEKTAADEDVLVAEVDGGQEVLIDTEVLTSLVKTILAEELAAKFQEMNDVIESVQADVQKMASEPDPTYAPVRGTVAVERATVTKSVTEADLLRQEAEEQFTAEVEYLQRMTKSGNPELRMRAQGQLEKMLDRAVMASGTAESL